MGKRVGRSQGDKVYDSLLLGWFAFWGNGKDKFCCKYNHLEYLFT